MTVSEALARLDAGEPLVCADLWALEVPGCVDHHSDAQRLDDERHCYCWVPPTDLIREGGQVWTSAEYEQQSCLSIQRAVWIDGVPLGLTPLALPGVWWAPVGTGEVTDSPGYRTRRVHQIRLCCRCLWQGGGWERIIAALAEAIREGLSRA